MRDRELYRRAVRKRFKFLYGPLSETGVPTSFIPRESWSAPARISEADADPLFISTTSGRFASAPSPDDLKSCSGTVLPTSLQRAIPASRNIRKDPPRPQITARIVPQVEHDPLCIRIRSLDEGVVERLIGILRNSWSEICAISPFISKSTLGTWMFARAILKSFGAVQPSRMTLKVTVVPSGPRISVTASSTFMVSVEVPLIAVIQSFAFSPAFSAGVPLSGAMITMWLLASVPSCAPMPPKSP